MKKIVILIIILVVVALGIYFYNKNQAKAPTVENNIPAQTQNYSPNQAVPAASSTVPAAAAKPAAAPLPPATAGGGETPGENIQVWEVDFTGSAFSPQNITIAQDDWIFFKNKSTINFWPQSTVSTAFGPGSAIGPGGEYKFQFTKIGTFYFIDKLNPDTQGMVVVK